MECNKDEAHRAMEIAERKFSEKDLDGAKKFAVKAQTLFPSLDGVSQFITALNVHLMAESKVAGEKDWYAIMSLSPSADESTVKKQYRLLALQLHPDKNHARGAEGAFKLVQEAFNVLKDKNKRKMYDQKRKTQAVNGHKTRGAGFSCSNGFKNQEKGARSDMRSKSQTQGTSQKATRPAPQPAPQPSPSTTDYNAQTAPQTATPPVSRPTKPRTARYSKKHASQTAAQPVPRPQNPNTTSCSAQGMAQNAARMGPQPFEPCTKQNMHRATPHSSVQDTFWTRCYYCSMWFEYNLIFKGSCLHCRGCRKTFLATDYGKPVISYKFDAIQAWMYENLASACGSNGSSIPNHGSSDNVSAGAGCQEGTRPCKRMRGEGSSNANGAS